MSALECGEMHIVLASMNGSSDMRYIDYCNSSGSLSCRAQLLSLPVLSLRYAASRSAPRFGNSYASA